jgi:sedoheptulokinase
MAAIVSLDIGTSKLCALALDLERLSPLAVRSTANDADVPGLPPGHHEQNPARIRDRVLELLGQLLADGAVRREEVRAVGLTGQMHGVLLADRNLQPATNLITWQDQRTLPPDQPGSLAELSQAVGAAEARTGCHLHAGYGGVTLYHMSRNGGLPKNCTALTIADFIAACLCGVMATEPTDAASWGLLNLQCGQWDQEMARHLGFPEQALPAIRPSSCPLGGPRPELARSLGLAQDTQVCSPVGDNQASILGVAGLARDAAVVNLGTGGQVSVPQSEAVWVEGFETRPMPFGGHMLVGASLCGGWSYAYLRRFFQDVVRQCADVELSDGQVYQRMNRLAAEAAAGAEGLAVDTRFAGARDKLGLRGAVRCVDAHNLTAGNLARAFIEGMVRELADMFHRATHANVHRIVASGNAVRENPLVVEVIESLFGRKCHTSLHAEEAALGAAYGAAIGMGLITPSDIPPRSVKLAPHFHRLAQGANKS